MTIRIALDVLAAVIIVGALIDVFVTVFSPNGAGPITDSWTRWLWRLLLFIHRRRSIHRGLAFAGPFMLVASILLWYLLIGIGLFILLAAHPSSVTVSKTGLPAEPIEKLYFVNTTISGLGYGDLVPSGFPWTLLVTASTFIATMVLTASISYVISVVGAAIERKKLAHGIFGLGESISEIIEFSRLDEPENSLKDYVTDLASTMDGHALKHLAYPILKYFHESDAGSSPVRAVLVFSDAFFISIQRASDRRPPPGVQRLLENSIRNYAQITHAVIPVRLPDQDPGHLIQSAREYGIAVESDPEFRTKLESYLALRRRLLALCYEDGWYEE